MLGPELVEVRIAVPERGLQETACNMQAVFPSTGGNAGHVIQMPVKSFQPMLRTADATPLRFNLCGHDALAA